MRDFKKLSMATIISLSVMGIGSAAFAQTMTTDPCPAKPACEVPNPVCEPPTPVCEPECKPKCEKPPKPKCEKPPKKDKCGCPKKACVPKTNCPTAYGAGPAGTFKAYGTIEPKLGVAAGTTEIATFRSETSRPTGAAAAMASQGIYGNCVSCQSSEMTGGASTINPSISAVPNENVATPFESNYTGGASCAESNGMTCVQVPKPPITTGGASCLPVATVPACIPQDSCAKRLPTAPPGFKLEKYPNTCTQDQSGNSYQLMQQGSNPAPLPLYGFERNSNSNNACTDCGQIPPPAQPAVTIDRSEAQSCNPEPACPTGGAASATSCGTADKANYFERQVYAYPQVSGTNTMIGDKSAEAVSLGGSNGKVSAANNLPMCETATGAAAPIYRSQLTGGASPVYQYPSNFSAKSANGKPIASPGGRITIQSATGIEIQRMVEVPNQMTGAAACIPQQFTDVDQNFWASTPINKLASAGIIAGYPDKTFKPDMPVSRAELSSMLVSGLNLQNTPTSSGRAIFTDVPNNFWAKADIEKVHAKGLVAGYPNSKFEPNIAVSRAEALTIMSKSIACGITEAQADIILSKYRDANEVPCWAKIPVAHALNTGLLSNSVNPSMIYPNQSSTRADIAAMLSQLRQSLAMETPNEQAKVTGAATSIQQESIVLPTLQVKFSSRLSARASQVGDKFLATTVAPITINGTEYPVGSTVSGKVIEVIRPGAKCDGGIKVAFESINSKTKTACKGTEKLSSGLPSSVVVAQVQRSKNLNLFNRIVEAPFVWTGRLIGITGRTVGGAAIITANATEQMFNELGLASSELTAGKPKAAGYSALSSAGAVVKAPIDIAKTTFSGASGLFQVSGDQLGFLMNADGSKVASINPNERVAIAFGEE